jgi:hypothetical protein
LSDLKKFKGFLINLFLLFLIKDFDERWYLEKYLDVKNAKLKPVIHYFYYGRFESRYGKAPKWFEDIFRQSSKIFEELNMIKDRKFIVNLKNHDDLYYNAVIFPNINFELKLTKLIFQYEYNQKIFLFILISKINTFFNFILSFGNNNKIQLFEVNLLFFKFILVLGSTKTLGLTVSKINEVFYNIYPYVNINKIKIYPTFFRNRTIEYVSFRRNLIEL